MPHYDLHSHTYYSDGTLSPTDLVLRAQANGVEVLALTDHDVTDGIAEAELAAAEVGLTLIPGVEVSVTWGSQTLHIVGLGVDRHVLTLQNGLKTLREFRVWRAEEIGRRLAKKGVAGAYEGAKALVRHNLISRTHFAHFLVSRGHAKDVRSVFKRYLTPGKPGYVPGEWASLEQAVSWIRDAGGQAVIAHPARYKLNTTRLDQLLTQFKEVGGEAIEVASGSHSRDDSFRFAAIATKYGLLSSCGSDYHGPESHWTDLGRLAPLPEQCIPVWRDWKPDNTVSRTAVALAACCAT